MEQVKATVKELDERCEDLIKQEFGQNCNFDVVDAVKKLERLGLVSRRADEIIGTTTEEVVMRAQQGTVFYRPHLAG